MGKTEFALQFAEEHNAEIVSCDASLVYRGMDIGTAKPTREERLRVPHHLIDVSPVDQPYDIVSFDTAARAAVDDITNRGKAVVVTGGSGFYLKSFLAPVIDTVVVDESIRVEVAEIFKRGGLSGLLEELRALSPDGLGSLDCMNPRRVLRALERCKASGKSLRQLQEAFAARPEPYRGYKKHLTVMVRGRDALKERVVQRAALMIEVGLVEEVRALKEAGMERNPSAASAIGYKETLAYIRGECSQEELLAAIVQNTMRLVKKQRTWFRTQIREPDRLVEL